LSDLNKSDQHLYIHAPNLEVFSIGGAFRSILFQEAQNLVSLRIFLADINEDFEEVILCNDYMLRLFSKLSKIKYLKLEGYICMVSEITHHCSLVPKHFAFLLLLVFTI